MPNDYPHHPDHPDFSVEDQLHLLRFPETLRAQLDNKVKSADLSEHIEDKSSFTIEIREPPPSTHISQGPKKNKKKRTSIEEGKGKPKKRKRKFLFKMLFFLTLIVVGWSLGLLEHQYQQLEDQGDRLSSLRSFIKKTKGVLTQLKTSKVQASPKLFQRYEGQFFRRYKAILTKECRLGKKSKFPWPKSWVGFTVYLDQWEDFLWESFGNQYISVRRKWTGSSSLSLQFERLCQKQPSKMLQVFTKHLQKRNTRLLASATQDLKWYYWCQKTWLPNHLHPIHGKMLKNIRHNSCDAYCKRGHSTSCRICLEEQQRTHQLTPESFKRYLRILRLEKNGRCYRWNRKPAHGGIFHIGDYFLKVDSVLRSLDRLEETGQCNQKCKNTRKTWGFQLIAPQKHNMLDVYVHLWPSKLVAPTHRLRHLPKKAHSLEGKKSRWLPAIRYDLLGGKSVRNLWFLMIYYDRKQNKRGYLPIAPHPGLKQVLKSPTHPIQIHNDGRQLIRFLTMSQDGSFLSFAQFRKKPWQAPPDFSQPHCLPRQTSTKATDWNTSVYIYPMLSDGLPGDKGHHLKLRGQVYGIQLGGGIGHRYLVLSSDYPPPGAENLQQNTVPTPHTSIQSASWKIPLRFGMNPFFGKGELFSYPHPKQVDLPLSADHKQFSVLRSSCPLPSKTFRIIQKDLLTNQSINHLSLQADRWLHAAQDNKTLALLTMDPDSKGKKSILYLLPRTQAKHHKKKGKRHLLSHNFNQVKLLHKKLFLAGGDWGTPLLFGAAPSLKELFSSQTHTRYFDPVLQNEQKRVYVVAQNKVIASKIPNHTVTFLLSRVLPSNRH